LLIVDRDGRIRHEPRHAWLDALRGGDLVVAKDAATLPASLLGTHLPTGRAIEVRLAGRRSLEPDDVRQFDAIVFGEGDYHERTEDRRPPPALHAGDGIQLGPLRATVLGTHGHPRLIRLRFDGTPDAIWTGLANHGHAIQYSHIQEPLALWDVWTAIAGAPVAFEAPSAAFVLDWRTLAGIRARGLGFATLSHAAGLSSTGDEVLDSRLPFAEPYEIPRTTAAAIDCARHKGHRVVAIGTTVVRALEHAGIDDHGMRAGRGVANQKIGPSTRLRVVDAILTGVHEPGTSHYELMRAFTDSATLERVRDELIAQNYRTHEFGDSILMELGNRVIE
jgi:S-adenosylmethionine:tRNA ribosyltransferase-isomerase